MYGQINDNTKVYGKIIKCMEKESLYGLMDVDIKDSMFMIKKRGTECLHGLIKELTK
jgi:exoribonuclease II